MSRNSTASRLRATIKARKSSLADDFEYRCFVLFFRKGAKKATEVFECERVGLSMTNDQEHAIMEGVRSKAYSQNEAEHLLTRDTVQIHAARWFQLESKELDAIKKINMVIWPAPYRHRIEVLCFSRWKNDSSKPGERDVEPYHLLQTPFCMYQDTECARNPLRFLLSGDRRAGIFFNFAQNLGLWLDPHADNTTSRVKMCMVSLMLCFAQDMLTEWSEQIVISPTEVMSIDRINELYFETDWSEIHHNLAVQPVLPMSLDEREEIYKNAVIEMKSVAPSVDQFGWMANQNKDNGGNTLSTSSSASSSSSSTTSSSSSSSSSATSQTTPSVSFEAMASSFLKDTSSTPSTRKPAGKKPKGKGKGKKKGKK